MKNKNIILLIVAVAVVTLSVAIALNSARITGRYFPNVAPCVDTDGGLNYLVRGAITGGRSGSISYSDECDLYSGNLIEYACYSDIPPPTVLGPGAYIIYDYHDGGMYAISYPCPGTCFNGECVSADIDWKSESDYEEGSGDSGTDSSSWGEESPCVDNDEDGVDACAEDGITPIEACGSTCDCNDNNDAIHPGAKEVCDDGVDNDCDGFVDCEDNDCDGLACADGKICVDGACGDSSGGQGGESTNGADTGEGGTPEGSADIHCSDSDGGKNYYVKGITKDKDFTKEDTCKASEPSKLVEWFCNLPTDEMQAIIHDCADEGKVCVDGACIREANKGVLSKVIDFFSNLFGGKQSEETSTSASSAESDGGASYCEDSDAHYSDINDRISTAGYCQDDPLGATHNDYCADSATIVEYSCGSSGCVSNSYKCSDYFGAGSRCDPTGYCTIPPPDCNLYCNEDGFPGGECGYPTQKTKGAICYGPSNSFYLGNENADQWCLDNYPGPERYYYCCCYNP